MTLWLSLAILAQCIIAGTVLVDKYVLQAKGRIGIPGVYAFYVSILSGAVVVLVPFGVVHLPSLEVLMLSLGVGFSYVAALLLLYRGLKKAPPSDVMPVVGAVSAMCSFILAFLFLGQELPALFTIGFILLTLGTLVMSHFRFSRELLITVIAAGILFGLSSILMKLVFEHTDFLDGFFWSRMGNVAGALLLALWPPYAHALFKKHQKTSGRKHTTTSLVIGNKVLNGIAFILTLRAIQLGDVSIVNALAGLQFIFLFFFAYVFSPGTPRAQNKEIHRPHEFIHVTLATLAIVTGLSILFSPELFSFL